MNRADTGPGNFDIVFNYDQVLWETGDASGGAGGLGGSSARVGYSNGVDRSFELPGSGTNGAFLDSNAVSGLVHNSRDSAQPGRYLFEVRRGVLDTGHQVGGRVINDAASGAGVAGAYVSACAPDGTCALTTSSGSGAYAIGGLADGAYTITAAPPGSLLPTTAAVALSGADATVDLHVTGPVPPPAGTAIGPTNSSSGGLPVVYWSDPLNLTTHACAGATVSYTVTLDGAVVRSGPMTEGPAGTYSATIAAFYPLHGVGHVHIDVVGCGTPTAVDFDVYIDPSGVVVDAEGHPIVGATVTLLRSNASTGPFSPVPDGDSIMSLSNRHNPDTTDADGHFGWDVIPGYYQVQASKAGCHAPGDAATPSVTTAVMQIPPPVTDLELVLDCGGVVPPEDVTPPTVACGSADAVWHPDNVAIACTATDAGSGLVNPADASFTLTTNVGSGSADANAATATREICDVAGNCATAGPIAGNRIDRANPTLTVPAGITVNATSPTGSNVSYVAMATDETDPSPVVACSPPSNTTFPIGTTTVTCTATDHAGNVSTRGFAVTVKGAPANLEVQSQEFQDRFKPLLEETSETVTVAGSYNRSQLAKLMARIDWVVVPSIWWENSPLVIQEAFLHGRPVICSDIGGMAEKVTDGVDGLHFRRGDAEHLAEVIERAARPPACGSSLRAGIVPGPRHGRPRCQLAERPLR